MNPFAACSAYLTNRTDETILLEWHGNGLCDSRHALMNDCEIALKNFGDRPQFRNLRHYTWIIDRVTRFVAQIARDMTVIAVVEHDDDNAWVQNDDRAMVYRLELAALADTELFSVLEAAYPSAPQSRIRAVSDHPQFVRAWREAQRAALRWLDATDERKAA